ncbi:MAG: dUTP diphosphatase [Candidatus Cloacimonetes bacterium]|nr:dUTP diphosphatase [Candidatus Cloacimonadota bacterium]
MKIKLLDQKAKLPTKMSDLAAGYDIFAFCENDIELLPFERISVSTGFAIALPKHYHAEIRPRSGLALHHGITVLNAPGTIDADYRGEVKVILINLSKEPFIVKNEMRIAQMIVSHHREIIFDIVETLDLTKRGSGGFGST